METKKTKKPVLQWQKEINKKRRERKRAVRKFEDEHQLRIDGLTDAEYKRMFAYELRKQRNKK